MARTIDDDNEDDDDDDEDGGEPTAMRKSLGVTSMLLLDVSLVGIRYSDVVNEAALVSSDMSRVRLCVEVDITMSPDDAVSPSLLTPTPLPFPLLLLLLLLLLPDAVCAPVVTDELPGMGDAVADVTAVTVPEEERGVTLVLLC